MSKPSNVRAVVLLAEGSEEIEFTTIVDILRRAEINVCVAGVDGNNCTKCSRDVKICPDVALSEAINEDYDIVILPGGLGGTEKFIASQEVKALLQKQEKNNKWIAAICAAPTALKMHGIAKGKTLTSYPTVKDDIMKDGEYKYSDEKVVVDGKLITSRAPGTAILFALMIVEKLVGIATRDKITEAILYV